MTRHANTIDVRALLLDESVDEPTAWTPPPATAPHYGARHLTAADRAVLERERRGEEHPRFAFESLGEAMRAAADYRDTGASVTSAASPSRFEGGGRVTGAGRQSNVTRVVDRLAGVLRALASMPPYEAGELAVPAPVCVDVLAWREAGADIKVGNAHTRVALKRGEVAKRLCDLVLQHHGLALTERQVARVTRHARAHVRALLEASGEIPVRVVREDPGEWVPRRRG